MQKRLQALYWSAIVFLHDTSRCLNFLINVTLSLIQEGPKMWGWSDSFFMNWLSLKEIHSIFPCQISRKVFWHYSFGEKTLQSWYLYVDVFDRIRAWARWGLENLEMWNAIPQGFASWLVLYCSRWCVISFSNFLQRTSCRIYKYVSTFMSLLYHPIFDNLSDWNCLRTSDAKTLKGKRLFMTSQQNQTPISLKEMKCRFIF